MVSSVKGARKVSMNVYLGMPNQHLSMCFFFHQGCRLIIAFMKFHAASILLSCVTSLG